MLLPITLLVGPTIRLFDYSKKSKMYYNLPAAPRFFNHACRIKLSFRVIDGKIKIKNCISKNLMKQKQRETGNRGETLLLPACCLLHPLPCILYSHGLAPLSISSKGAKAKPKGRRKKKTFNCID